MTLDDLVKKNAAWLEQAMQHRMLGKVDAKATRFSENQWEQRKAELDKRIGDLELRKAEAMAAYDLAIERERQELEAVKREKSPTVERMPAAAAPSKSSRKKKSRK